ncbi:hypothetical protein [Zhenhengia yiwuensis]|uniref:Uncharacterized protein n=1 Tax=Zhenhengia yiwuensis TaxID=2763666 RepID=A0A926IAP1_9FIRM|nr:hypothetical protein [Zhenhengia yiwuensis]MBC8581090.1 hypothetical protein [Zhenhengia yiwuensis]
MNKRLKKKMELKDCRLNKRQLRRKVQKQEQEVRALEEALKKAYKSYKEQGEEIEKVRTANKALFELNEKVGEENRLLEIEQEEFMEKVSQQKYYILELEEGMEGLRKQVFEMREELVKYNNIPSVIKKICMR